MTINQENYYGIKIEQLSRTTYRWRVGRARGTASSRRAAIRGAEKYIKKTLNTAKPEIVPSKFKKVLKDPSLLLFPEPKTPAWGTLSAHKGVDGELVSTTALTVQEYKITILEKQLEDINKKVDTLLLSHESDGSTFEEFCITCEVPYPCEVRTTLQPESITNIEEEYEDEDEDEEY